MSITINKLIKHLNELKHATKNKSQFIMKISYHGTDEVKELKFNSIFSPYLKRALQPSDKIVDTITVSYEMNTGIKTESYKLAK